MRKFEEIQTYYRLNTDMAKLIISDPRASIGHMHGHRFQVAMEATPDALAFVAANDGALVMELTYSELSGEPSMAWATAKTKYVLFGVSLKEAIYEDFKILTENPTFTILDLHKDVLNDERRKTANPNIFKIISIYAWHDPKTRLGLTKEEQDWIDMWKGVDIYYQYSDSLSVYKAGKAACEHIFSEGKKLGIPRKRMDELFQKYVK